MKWLERLFRLYFALLNMQKKARTTELRALKAYVHAVRLTRLSMIALIGFVLTALVATIGGVALLSGVVLLLPLSTQQRLWCLTVMGAVLFFAPLLALSYILSDSVWLEKSGIQSALGQLANRKPPEPTTPEPEIEDPMSATMNASMNASVAPPLPMNNWDLSQPTPL